MNMDTATMAALDLNEAEAAPRRWDLDEVRRRLAETARDWGRPIEMDAAVTAHVEALFRDLKL